MIKEYLEIGQIVGTHGVRGEMRLNPWCDGPEFVKQFHTLYGDAQGNESVKVLSCRPHGNIVLLKIEGVATVDQAQALRGKVLYMKRSDAHLPEGKWFVAELIGCRCVDADDNAKEYGTIADVASGAANDVWTVRTPDGGDVLIPAIKDVVVRCDVAQNVVYLRPIRGLFDED